MTAEIPKHFQLQFKHATWPKLMILREKHDPGYYYLEDIHAVPRAALKILRERFDQRWYSEPEETPYGLEEEVTDEVLRTLPESLKSQALLIRKRNKVRRKDHQDAVDTWCDIKAAIANEDGWRAYQVLRDRADHEYENISLENLEKF